MRDLARVKNATAYVWCEFCGRPFSDRENRNQHIRDTHL